MARNLFERRGNFGNLTLRGMTETYAYTNTLPKEWKNKARISNDDIPNTYEVSNYYNPYSQGNIENIRYGSMEHKGIRLHLFDSTKFVFPKIATA